MSLSEKRKFSNNIRTARLMWLERKRPYDEPRINYARIDPDSLLDDPQPILRARRVSPEVHMQYITGTTRFSARVTLSNYAREENIHDYQAATRLELHEGKARPSLRHRRHS